MPDSQILTMEDIKNCITFDKFKQWLLSKDGDEIVGMSKDHYSCPISNYLLQFVPGTKVYVGCDFVIIKNENPFYQIAWVPYVLERFVREFAKETCNYPSQTITASQALDILLKIDKPSHVEKMIELLF